MIVIRRNKTRTEARCVSGSIGPSMLIRLLLGSDTRVCSSFMASCPCTDGHRWARVISPAHGETVRWPGFGGAALLGGAGAPAPWQATILLAYPPLAHAAARTLRRVDSRSISHGRLHVTCGSLVADAITWVRSCHGRNHLCESQRCDVSHQSTAIVV